MMNRRQIVAGALAAPVAGVHIAAAAPVSQAEIAQEVHALASRLSMLLGQLDEGAWEVRVSPPFKNAPIYSVDPVHVSPEAQLHLGIKATKSALNKLYPGGWRVEHNAANSFLIFIDDDWHKGRAKA